MMTITCPGCEATSSVPESEAGTLTLCLHCGARFTVPAPPASGAGAEATTFTGVMFSSTDSVRVVLPEWQDDSPPPPPKPAPAATPARAIAAAPHAAPHPGATTVAEARPFTARVWLPIVALLVAGGVIGAAILAATLPFARRASAPPAPPDAIDYATARFMKEQAESLALAGRLEEANQKYQELFNRAGDREPRDPRTRQTLETARAHREKVYEALFARVTDRKPPAPPAAPETSAPSPAPASQPAVAEATAPTVSVPSAPTTSAPTTSAPTTSAPTTSAPTTSAPTTSASIPSAPVPSAPAPPVTASATTAPAPTTVPAATAPAQGAATSPQPPVEVSDHQIGQAIRRGVDYLLAQFDDKTHALKTAADLNDAYRGGENALAVYALLQSGTVLPDDARLNVRGPAMRARIEAMKSADLATGHPQVYALGIRAAALSLFNLKEDQPQLREDVARLLGAHSDGAYTYSVHPVEGPAAARDSADNSNSQFGLLGVWSGAEAGIDVPGAYWAAVERHWESKQLPDGRWNYYGDDSEGTLSMTVAGIASLFVTHDWLHGAKSASGVGNAPFSPPLARGLRWLETRDNYKRGLGGTHVAYTMYGIERVGLASGYKYFGEHDWYRELSREAVRGQGEDGAWNGTVIDTAFTLLFLARGRHPILMNKLRFDRAGRRELAWANRPRDLANLARFASRQLERELNWQVVPLARPWQEWLDAPVLYLASHKPPELTPQDVDNLRGFVDAGGLLFTHADNDSAAFNKFAEDLARQLFPKYELRDLHHDHELYASVFKLDENERPRLRVVENGSRLLIVHSTTDLARFWQQRERESNRGIFRLGVNLFVYAAGKRDFRNRLESTYVADPGPTPPNVRPIPVARLSYPGNWQPEPYAWTRFGRWFQWRHRAGSGPGGTATAAVAPVEVRLSDLKPGEATVAHLTGTARHDFSQADADAARAFVEAGGVLLIDQCGGTGVFDQSVRQTLLPAAFPGAAPEPLKLDHPLLRPARPGMADLTAVKLRPYAVERLGKSPDPRLSVLRHGKGHVLLTPLDLTSGLLGTRTWGISGYDPDYAQALLSNVLLWSANGQPLEMPRVQEAINFP